MLVYIVNMEHKVRDIIEGDITEYRADGFRITSGEDSINYKDIPHEVFMLEKEEVEFEKGYELTADDSVYLEENDVYLSNVRNITPEPTMQELKKEADDLKEALDFLLFSEGGDLS